MVVSRDEKFASEGGGSAVDDFSRAFYELLFRNAYLESRGEEFQGLFSTLMEKRHPNDFFRTRPWGNRGDRKNDGYLRSARTLFQCYAPNEMREADALAKIDEDFLGALPHWRAHFDTWVFVHNARDGLGPGVLAKLLDLGNGHKYLRVESWGFEELRRVVFELSLADLASLLGPVPSRTEVLNVQFPEIRLVIEHIAHLPEPAEPDLRPVSPKKLNANALSPAVGRLLRAGMGTSPRVGEFFDGYYDPTLGDRMAQAFRREYERQRDAGLSPDDLFARLQLFAGGVPPATPARQAAALTVLAYLFEECDIFERPREEPGP